MCSSDPIVKRVYEKEDGWNATSGIPVSKQLLPMWIYICGYSARGDFWNFAMRLKCKIRVDQRTVFYVENGFELA